MRSVRASLVHIGLTAATALLIASGALGYGAAAEVKPIAKHEQGNAGISVRSVQEVIASQTSGGGGGRPVRCAFFEPGEDIYGISQVEAPVEGETYSLLCWHSDKPDWTWSPTRYVPEVVYTPAVYDLLVEILVSEAYAEVTPAFIPRRRRPTTDLSKTAAPDRAAHMSGRR